MSPYQLRNLLLSSLLAVITACTPAEQEPESNAQMSAESQSLENTKWQLVELTVLGGHIFEPDEPGKYELYFRTGERLTGSSDCNDIEGSWFQDGSALRFEPFRVTRALCAPGSLHNNYALYMKDVSGFSLEGEHLILTSPTEGVAVKFAAVE